MRALPVIWTSLQYNREIGTFVITECAQQVWHQLDGSTLIFKISSKTTEDRHRVNRVDELACFLYCSHYLGTCATETGYSLRLQRRAPIQPKNSPLKS